MVEDILALAVQLQIGGNRADQGAIAFEQRFTADLQDFLSSLRSQ